MVEVTQHGEAFHKGACKKCHCEFNFSLRDISYDKDNSKFPFIFLVQNVEQIGVEILLR